MSEVGSSSSGAKAELGNDLSARPGLGAASLVGILLSSALVVWLLFELDLSAVARALTLAEPFPLLLATLIYSTLFLLRGIRWAVLLHPLTPVSVGAATRSFLIGFMANNILPARLGDVLRAVVLAREAAVPASATFATVFLERVFDGLTVVMVLGTALFLLPLDHVPERASELRSVGALMALVFVSAFSLAVLLAVAEASTLAVLARVLAPIPPRLREKLLGLFECLGRGLRALRSASRTLTVVALSLCIWTLEVVVYVFVALSLGIEVSALGLSLVMAVLTLGLTAPSAPGFVGVFEALVIPSLAVLGVVAAEAAAFALILHGIHYFPGTLLGLVAAWRSPVSLRELFQRRPASIET